MSRLLTDEEKQRAVADELARTRDCPDKMMDYSDIIARAQDSQTLKAVGEKFERGLAPEDTWLLVGRKFIEALKKGEMPE